MNAAQTKKFNNKVNMIKNNQIAHVFIDFDNYGMTEADVITLGAAIAVSTSLTEFKFEWNHSTPAGIAALANGVAACASLKSFKTWGQNLDASQLGDFVNALKNNHNIDDFGVYHAPIGDAGAAVIADAIENAGLKKLTLFNAGVSDAGVQSISGALTNNPNSLEKLDLPNNQITDVGVTSLASAVAIAGNLEHLGLASNQQITNLSDLGVAIKNNNNIKQLDLSSNQIDDSSMASFASNLESSAIENLSLSGNSISDAGLETLIISASKLSNLGNLNADIPMFDPNSDVETVSLAEKFHELMKNSQQNQEDSINSERYEYKIIEARKEVRKILEEDQELIDLKQNDPAKFEEIKKALQEKSIEANGKTAEEIKEEIAVLKEEEVKKEVKVEVEAKAAKAEKSEARLVAEEHKSAKAEPVKPAEESEVKLLAEEPPVADEL